jgi:hypothetical protein
VWGRLLDGLDGAIGAVEESRRLRVLFSPESLTTTVAAAGSIAFRARIREALRPYVEAAKSSGELRELLDSDAVADWLVRVAQMLMIEQLTSRPVVAGIDRRAVLRDFVISGLLSSSMSRLETGVQ